MSDRLVIDFTWYKTNQEKLGIYTNVFIKNRIIDGNQADHPMSESSATQFLASTVKTYCESHGLDYEKNKLGIHKIRHKYFSEGCDEIDIDEATIKKLMNLSNMMGHSNINTGLKHYFKMKNKKTKASSE